MLFPATHAVDPYDLQCEFDSIGITWSLMVRAKNRD